MTLFVCAAVFPALFVVLSLGLGLLVERAGGFPLPGVLLAPLGFAVIVVVSQMTTYFEWAAPTTPWVVLALALIGLALGRERLRAGPIDRWALACAVGVYAALITPVVLSGQASFAGYGLDTVVGVHFMGADFLLHHGTDFGRLERSAYEYTLKQYFDRAYPSGGHTALGAVRALVGQDVPWVYQPYMALLVALSALGVYALLARVIASRALRAAIAFIATQPALVYAYALQGSIKELAAAVTVVLLAALVPAFAGAVEAGPRRVIPLAVAGAAGLAAIGLAFAVWLVPLALACLAIAALAPPRGWRAAAWDAGAFAAALALLAWPILAQLHTYLSSTGFLTTQTELGNLLRPLKAVQAFGIWPAGDYRITPRSNVGLTYALIGAAAVGAVLGIVWIARRRAWTVALYLGVSALAWAYVTVRGSPWADGKALMLASPAVVLAALLGATALHAAGRRLEAVGLGGAIAFGVLWSNALAYHDTAIAPRARLVELGHLGSRLAGRGPTLKPEFEEYALYFLRDDAPEGPSDAWRRRPARLRSGALARYGSYHDLDELAPAYVRDYPAIALRRSPATSRPPAPYHVTWRGRFYDAWERPASAAGTVLAHLPLGDRWQPAAQPRCADVRALARRAARDRARLAYAPRGRSVVLLPSQSHLSSAWFIDPGDPELVRTRGPGELDGSVAVPRGARYELWAEGSFSRAVTISIDGRRAGDVAYQFNEPGQYAHVADVALGPGRHLIRAVRGGGDLHPGNGNDGTLGAIVLRPRSAVAGPIGQVPPAGYRALCERTLDWIEVVR